MVKKTFWKLWRRRLCCALTGNARNQLAAGLDLERRAGKIVSDWLVAAAEMLGEERLGHPVEGEPVLRPHETMSLVGKRDVGDGHGALLEGGHHLLGFRGHHPDVPHPLCDQNGLGRSIEMVNRRALGKKGATGL